MSSPVSTITSNVNLLLLDTYNIVNSNQPYVAYVSSVTAPGKIATVRDSTGNLGTNFFKIRVSTTKGVSFTDGTNFFDITQPFGYVTMSSRDRNTWNILNAYAFPDPYGISYVSTVNVRDRFTTPSVFASSFISTVHLNARSISTLNIQATNISTNNIFVNTISTNNLSIKNSIDCQNIVISNVSQATILNSVQTNLIMPISLLITTSNSDQITPSISFDIYSSCNASPFTYVNTGFSNYEFTLYFNGIDINGSKTGDFGYYFYLSNSTKSNVSYGRHFNNIDNTNYFIQLENPITQGATNFTFSDIYNLSGWDTNDSIYLFLRAYNGGDNNIVFTKAQLSIIYKPLFV